MAVSECPECTCHIPMPPGLEKGDALECPDCGARLMVKSVFPPVFGKAEGD